MAEVPAAKEKIDAKSPMQNAGTLPETRVRGSHISGTACIEGWSWLSSTTRWGCGHVYDGTASVSLVQRYYSSQFGRFMTPDPYKAGSGGNDLDDPKSWNRYAYVLNDPVNYGDPTGQFGVKPCGGLDPYCQSDGLIFPPIGYPTGSRYAPADPLPPFDRWDQLSPDCQQGLETAMKGPDNAGNTRIRLAALDRAQKAQSVLQSAVAGTNIDWTVLAAIGIRESKFSPGSLSGNGMYGAFQINPSANGLTLDQAQNLSLAQQANIAVQNLTLFASRFSAISAEYGIDPILPAIANYDGVAPSKIINALLSGNPAALDQLTDRHNYISNVLDLTNCFK